MEKPVDVLEQFRAIPSYALGEVPEQVYGGAYRTIIAKRALTSSYEDTESDPVASITDILADLRHLCNTLGIDYAECNRMAAMHYREELFGADAH
jgi:hypothetical protein